MNGYILQNTCWRTGVLLKYEDNEALVKADLEDRRITVAIRKGNARTRRELLAIIRKDFKAIHDTITGIKVQERVPVPGQPKIDVDYKHLLRLEERRDESYLPEGAEEPVNVRDMLDGVAAFEERQEQREGYRREDEFRLRREAKRLEAEPEQPVTLQPAPEAIVPAAPAFNHKSLVIAVISLLLIFGVVIYGLTVLSKSVDKSLLPVVLIGGILLSVFLIVSALRMTGAITEEQFTNLTTAVLEKLHLVSSKPTAGKAVSGGKADAKGKAALKGDTKPKVLQPGTAPMLEPDPAQKAATPAPEPKATKTARAKKTDTT